MSILDDNLDITPDQLIKTVVLRYIRNSDYPYKNEVNMDNLFYEGHTGIYVFKDHYRMAIVRLGFEGEGGYRVHWDAGIPTRGWDVIVSDKQFVTLDKFLKEIGEWAF